MKDMLLSRREALSAAAAVVTGFSVGGTACAAADTGALPLITKAIPATGERLPVIGLGTNQFSVESPAEMAQLQQVLQTMADRGGNVIDTARSYGRSEEVIGELLGRMANRDRFFISTKTPSNGELRAPDAEVQTSFERLRVDKIDLMLTHQLYEVDQLMPALIRAKEKGRLRYIGMSTSSDEHYPVTMQNMRRFPLDFIQVDYSIANRNSAQSILPLAQERRIAVLINVPFGGRRGASATFGVVKGKALPEWAAEFDVTSWAQFFLKYVVSHPAVTATIPGTTQVRHLIDNQGAGRGRLPDAAMRRRIEQYWDSL